MIATDGLSTEPVPVSAPAEKKPFDRLASARLLPIPDLRQPDPFNLRQGEQPHISQQSELWDTRFHHKDSIAAKLRDSGLYDEADKLDACHGRKTIARCVQCGKTEVFFNRCDQLFCPTCQPRIARKRIESISWYAEQLKQPKHLVLTARNTAKLTLARVKFLKSALAKLRRSKFAREVTTTDGITSYPWKGGTWSLETTCEEQGWHLHFHLLVESRFINAAVLARKWGKLVGQEFAIVKVKDARRADYLKELIKYAVKPNSLAGWTSAQVADFVRVFSGVRTFGVFGELFKLRAQHKEWRAQLAELRETCSCGCKHRQFFSEQEWEWYCCEHETGPPQGMTSNVRPSPRAELQNELRLN